MSAKLGLARQLANFLILGLLCYCPKNNKNEKIKIKQLHNLVRYGTAQLVHGITCAHALVCLHACVFPFCPCSLSSATRCRNATSSCGMHTGGARVPPHCSLSVCDARYQGRTRNPSNFISRLKRLPKRTNDYCVRVTDRTRCVPKVAK